VRQQPNPATGKKLDGNVEPDLIVGEASFGMQWIFSDTLFYRFSAPARGPDVMSAYTPSRPLLCQMTGSTLVRKPHQALRAEDFGDLAGLAAAAQPTYRNDPPS
jgi:hypothetical protein